MTSTVENGITIEISGDENSGKTLVGSICHKALTKAGFANVSMTNQQGELMEPYEVRTVLDAVLLKSPELLNTPIGIIEVTDLYEEPLEVVELSDATIRVSGDDDATADPMTEALEELRARDDDEVSLEADEVD